MRVLVFGGTRFIGRAIVDRLLRDGHDITLVNRGRSPDPFGTRVRRVVGDRRDHDTIRRAARRREHDAVVDVTAYHESETAAVVEAFQDRIGHLFHISTVAVYLIRDGIHPPFRELDFAGRTHHHSPRPSYWLYAFHKRRCEEVLWAARDQHGFPATALRLPMVVGEHDYTLRARAYLERIADSGPVILPDGGLNSWGFLWVDDIAEVVASNLVNATAFGHAYNLAQREALSLRTFVSQAAACLGCQPEILSIPSDWLRAVGLGTAFSPYTHDGDILVECRAAEEDLFFRPTPCNEWVERLARSFADGWNGSVSSFAATRSYEHALAREVGKVRLPTYISAVS